MTRFLLLVMGMWLITSGLSAQNQEPWTKEQLMETSTLASLIKKKQTGNMVIISIGPDEVIPGSINIGPTGEKANLERLKKHLKNTSKDKEIILYCGCCPFDRCPNIRPAFKALKDMGFKKPRLLNIPKNIKVDWIDKDYPVID
ncbi:MAG: rhodanese-like domain-containing protein [Chitinophagales bacterium]|nr:rhodanese-like domain-containing protein [Chitinophagales bacterium]